MRALIVLALCGGLLDAAGVPAQTGLPESRAALQELERRLATGRRDPSALRALLDRTRLDPTVHGEALGLLKKLLVGEDRALRDQIERFLLGDIDGLPPDPFGVGLLPNLPTRPFPAPPARPVPEPPDPAIAAARRAEAVSLLSEAMSSDDVIVRATLIQGLIAHLSSPPTSSIAQRWQDWAGDDATASLLKKAAEDADAALRLPMLIALTRQQVWMPQAMLARNGAAEQVCRTLEKGDLEAQARALRIWVPAGRRSLPLDGSVRCLGQILPAFAHHPDASLRLKAVALCSAVQVPARWPVCAAFLDAPRIAGEAREATWAVRLEAFSKMLAAPASYLPRLVALSEEGLNSLGSAQRAELLGSLAGLGERGLPLLPSVAGQLEHPDPRVCRQTLRVLARLGPEARAVAKPKLVAFLSRSHEPSQEAGLCLIDSLRYLEPGDLDDTGIQSAVAALASDDHPSHPNVAGVARGQLARADLHRQQLKAIRRALAEGDSAARRDALSRLRREDAVHLVGLISQATRDAEASVRAAAAWKLAEVGPAALQESTAVVQLLKDPDRSVREAAAAALRFAHPERPVLLVDGLALAVEDERQDVRLWALDQLLTILGRARDETSEPSWAAHALQALSAATADSDAEVRLRAARALGSAPSDAMATSRLLAPLLRDADRAVREAAIQSLERVSGDDRAPLVAGLVSALGDEKQEVRARAAEKLNDLPVDSLRGLLLPLSVASATESDPAVQQALEETLSKLGIPRPRGPGVASPGATGIRLRTRGEDRWNEAEEALALDAAEIAVRSDGISVETTLTLRIEGRSFGRREAEVVIPLPDDAIVSGYALDVEGELVDAALVERGRAARAFERELTRTIDPGLAESQPWNALRIRIWPVEHKDPRTLRCSYVQGARRSAQRPDQVRVSIPIAFAQPVGRLSLDVRLPRRAERPGAAGASYAELAFDAGTNDWHASKSWQDVRPGDDLTLSFEAPQALVATGSLADGETFFAISDVLEAERAAGGSRDPGRPRIGIAWDASLSRASAGRERELRVLARLLERLGDAQLEVVVFRDRVEPPRRFSARNDAKALLNHLRGQPCDGATDLGLLRLDRRLDYWVLFTDGVGTLGDPWPTLVETPVWVVTSGPAVDRVRLEQLVERSNGRLIELNRVSDEQAVQAIGQPAPRVLDVDYDEASLADVVVRTDASSGQFVIAGRLLASPARLTVGSGPSGGETRRPSYELRDDDARRSDLVPKRWAMLRSAELAVDPQRHRDELVHLGRRFGIATPGTSFLVLETLEQHLSYGVEPPMDRPEMRAEHAARKAEAETAWRAELDLRRARMDRLWTAVADTQARVPESVTSISCTGLCAVVVEERWRTNRDVGASVSARAGTAMAALSQLGALPGDYGSCLLARSRYGETPALLAECATRLAQAGRLDLAQRTLTSIVERHSGDPAWLRLAAAYLLDAGLWDRAIDVLTRGRELDPEDPHSDRMLGIALSARAEERWRQPTQDAAALRSEWAAAARHLEAAAFPLGRATLGGSFAALLELKEVEARLSGTGAAVHDHPSAGLYVSVTDLLEEAAWRAARARPELQVSEPRGTCQQTGAECQGLFGTEPDGARTYASRWALPGPYRVSVRGNGPVLVSIHRRSERSETTHLLRVLQLTDDGIDFTDDWVEADAFELREHASFRADAAARRGALLFLLGREAADETTARGLLGDADPVVRLEAARTLWQQLGCPPCAEAGPLARSLREAFDAAPGPERKHLLSRLGAAGAALAAPLRRFLKDPDPEMRSAAFVALARAASSPAVAVAELERCLDDPDLAVRQACLAELWLLGPAGRPALESVHRLEREPALAPLARAVSETVELGPQAFRMLHKTPGCLIAGEQTAVAAEIAPAENVARARVYFTTESSDSWFNVEMRRPAQTPGRFSFVGVLPETTLTSAGLRVRYSIQVVSTDFTELTTREIEVPVVARPEQCQVPPAFVVAEPPS